jgi:FkbM family methyltransferase
LGIYDLGRARLVAEKVRAGTVFYDVGASAGYYAILASHAVGENGKVVAFEPNPLNVACLRRHIEINKLRNVEIVEAAVYGREGELPFDPIDPRSGRLNGRLSGTGSMIIRAVKLDDLAGSALPVPRYIKMNIEGGELDALRGARGLLAEHPVEVFLATHGERVRQQCLDLLEVLGYAAAPIGGARSELYCYRK